MVDPSLFSQAVMYYASQCASTGWPGEPEKDPILDEHPDEDIGSEVTPVMCMERAHRAVIKDSSVIGGGCDNYSMVSITQAFVGASTACLINLDATTGRLRSAK